MLRAFFRARNSALAVVLAIAAMLGSAAPVYARTCDQRVSQAERNLHQAIRRHGINSRQAQNRRYQLERARESCRTGWRR